MSEVKIPKDLQEAYKRAKHSWQYASWNAYEVVPLIERIAALQAENERLTETAEDAGKHIEDIENDKAELFADLQTCVSERDALQQQLHEAQHGPCCREPWCEGECTCEICAPALALKDLRQQLREAQETIERLKAPVSENEAHSLRSYMNDYSMSLYWLQRALNSFIASRASEKEQK